MNDLRIFVLAGNINEYEKFILDNRLSRFKFPYLSRVADGIGERAKVIRIGSWRTQPEAVIQLAMDMGDI